MINSNLSKESALEQIQFFKFSNKNIVRHAIDIISKFLGNPIFYVMKYPQSLIV